MNANTPSMNYLAHMIDRFRNRFHTAYILFGCAILLIALNGFEYDPGKNENIIYHISDTSKENIRLYLKDEKNNMLLSLSNLKSHIERSGKKLIMGMNGGMYQMDHSPLGLYIENGKTIHKLNTADARGNFYLKPNGVFYLTNQQAGVVCTTEKFTASPDIKWATQSGPMLVIDGKIHPEFRKGSTNLNIRNGVGILPDGKVLFAISKEAINLYDFATFFLDMGCMNALYLDGSVSRMYLPSKNKMDLDGDFGVMIGITEK